MQKFTRSLAAFTCLGALYTAQGFSSAILNHANTTDLSSNTIPWTTGPIIAPSAHTVPPQHWNIEPYFYLTATTGFYNENRDVVSTPNFYSFLQQNPIQVGLNEFISCQITPEVFYQFTQGEHSTQFGDLPLSLGFQLLNDKPGTQLPAIKLAIKATIPFGKFKKLNPNKLGTDGVGSGSWMPGIGLNFSRIYQLTKTQFLIPRLAFGYTIPNPVQIKGLSTYGGTIDTSGTVYPGNIFSCVFAFEYTITKQFTFAMDFYYEYANKTRFSGNPGLLTEIATPSSDQFSLAPGLEYNWNANIGLIAGVWFTVAGRNSSQFTSGVIALNIYI